MHNKKTRNILIVVISLVAIFVIAAMCFVGAVIYEWRNAYSETTDVNLFTGRDGLLHWDEYEEYFSYLLSFPESTEDINVEEFFYRTDLGGFDTTYQIFMRYTMSEEKYAMEKARLANISMEYNGEQKNAILVEDVYEKPIYVMACDRAINWMNCYEYVILDDEKQEIVCVFLQLAEVEDSKIPKEYLVNEELVMERISDDYNMYYFKMGEGITGMPKLEEK